MATFPFTNGIADEASALAGEVQQTVVQVRSRRGNGSGVIWRADGQIITNHHVAQSDDAEIETHDGKKYAAHVTARDEANDLAVLSADEPGLNPKAATPGDSRHLKVGQLVLAVGHPLGMKGAVTTGIISAFPKPDGGRELIRADILLQPGNSGGPLVDSAGHVIGINAMVAGPGIGLAVPAHLVEAFLGAATTPKLGIVGREVNVGQAVAQRAGLTEANAVLLTEIVSGGPAELAGLLPGDVIVGVNGTQVTAARDMVQVLSLRDPAAIVQIRVLRGGAIQDVYVPPQVAA